MESVEKIVTKFIANEILRGSSSTEMVMNSRLLEDGVLDSLGLQQLVTFLENEFSIVVDDDFLEPDNFESVSAIASFVDEIRK